MRKKFYGYLPREYLADQLNENVVKQIIQHDLRLGERGKKRDPQLLEALFRLFCIYAGQSPSIKTLTKELPKTLNANLGFQRVRAYLKFLNDTLLVCLIPSLEIRLKKKRNDPKICICDHGLRNSWLQEYIPLEFENEDSSQDVAKISGHLAEGIVGSFFASIGSLDISYLPERSGEPEIDFILTIGEQRIPVEVKYRNTIRDESYSGLLYFIQKPINRAPFGILISKRETETKNKRIIVIPLKYLLAMR